MELLIQQRCRPIAEELLVAVNTRERDRGKLTAQCIIVHTEDCDLLRHHDILLATGVEDIDGGIVKLAEDRDWLGELVDLTCEPSQ